MYSEEESLVCKRAANGADEHAVSRYGWTVGVSSHVRERAEQIIAEASKVSQVASSSALQERESVHWCNVCRAGTKALTFAKQADTWVTLRRL